MKSQHQIENYLETLKTEVEVIEQRADSFQAQLQKSLANMPKTGVWTNVPEEPVIEASTVIKITEPVPLYTYLTMLYSAQVTVQWVLEEPK